MFALGYNLWHPTSSMMNGSSVLVGQGHRGESPVVRLLRSVRAAAAPDASGGWSPSGGAAPARAAPRPSDERREGLPLVFVFEPLKVPSVVRPHEEPHVLYVRLSAPVPSPVAARPGRTAGAAPAASVAVMPDPAEVIRAELAAAGDEGRPVTRAVLVGTDAILDPRAARSESHPRAMDLLVETLRALAEARVPFVWRMRGGIEGALPQVLAEALAAAGPRVTVELGIPTLDGELCRAFEGGPGVDPAQRLRLAAALSARGVAVRGLVDPLVPMLTDQPQMLGALMQALAEAGVSRVGARYILLTRERGRAIARRLAGMQRALVEGVFADEPWHEAQPDVGVREVHKRIPAHLRRAGHHRIVEAGARCGVLVDILDPVRPGEEPPAHSATDVMTVPSSRPLPARARQLRRARPQLDLFRTSVPRDS